MALRIDFYDGRAPITTHFAVEFMTHIELGFVCVIQEGPAIVRTVPANIVHRIEPVDVNITLDIDAKTAKDQL